MAAGDPDIGTGTTITYAGVTAALLSASWDGMSRGSINFSNMATTGAHRFKPTDLADLGSVNYTTELDASEKPPMVAAVSLATITFPETSTWGFSAFLTDFTFDVPFEDKMTATYALKADGDVTVA